MGRLRPRSTVKSHDPRCPVRIYLDDLRTPQMSGYDPEDWVVVRDGEAFLALARDHTDELQAVSFDHDLGLSDDGELLPSGYDVLKAWIEEFEPDPAQVEVRVHSANPVGAENMRAYWRSWCRHQARQSPETPTNRQ